MRGGCKSERADNSQRLTLTEATNSGSIAIEAAPEAAPEPARACSPGTAAAAADDDDDDADDDDADDDDKRSGSGGRVSPGGWEFRCVRSEPSSCTTRGRKAASSAIIPPQPGGLNTGTRCRQSRQSRSTRCPQHSCDWLLAARECSVGVTAGV